MAEQLEPSKKEKKHRAYVLASGQPFDADAYEYKDGFVPANIDNPFEVHTTAELVAGLEKHKEWELDARVMGQGGGKRIVRSLERASFLDSFKNPKSAKFREGVIDTFGTDSESDFPNTGLVGDDFTPYLGGPFYKNLYFYQDYIRMHSQAFFAYHHDPFAKAIVTIVRDFTLGRGFRVDSENKVANSIWAAFVEANDLQEQFAHLANELSIYGETMIWCLPNNESKITYQLRQGEQVPHGLLPRVRLIDPSNIVEIVTFPEDISRKLFYVWLAPTQYQIYTGLGAGDGTQVQPTLKFIYQQIPAEQMIHVKVNGASNEKRGRSDLYPVLGYMKRLRDIINYGIIGAQKQMAWSIDTTVEGSPEDIDAYVSAMQSVGTIAPAGSEFVHSAKIKREYQSNQLGRGGSQEIFQWVLSMISAGTQIPVNYFGTHLSGGQTRASALVATEPVAKKFEMRQVVYENVLKKLWNHVMETMKLGYVPCEITFPDIMVQDRSAKLKDLALAQSQGWLSVDRCAEIAAKELEVDGFNYEKEKEKMSAEPEQGSSSPLTMPGLLSTEPAPEPTGVSGEDRKQLDQNDGY